MSNSVQLIEENIRRAKEFVEMNTALERLARNQDFKIVILHGYLKDEAIRLVHLKSDPSMQTAERQASVVGQIDAIGGLLSYFRTVAHNAGVAAKAIEADEATRDELLAEEMTQ